MSDIHALSGAYAVDALDDIERAQFERHLAECGECRAEVDSLRAASAFLAETAEQPAPPELRQRVLADISQVRPLPPVVPERTASIPDVIHVQPRPARRAWLPRLAAAAAVIVALGAGAAVWHPWSSDTRQVATSLADQVINAPDVHQLHDDLTNGAQVTIFRSVSKGRAVITASDMPAPPSGHVYQLWLQNTHGEMVPAGFMADHPTVLDGDAAHAIGAGITVEPTGGSAQPTTKPVVLFHFQAAAT